jgi:hypothetical protein
MVENFITMDEMRGKFASIFEIGAFKNLNKP